MARLASDEFTREGKFLSFGFDCRAGFQMRRYFGKPSCLPTIFDRQVTPPQAIYAYLERDFRGLFEERDVEEVSGYLYNMRYGVRFSHEVHAAFKSGYQPARAEHERLCEATRAALHSGSHLNVIVHAHVSFTPPDDLDRYLRRAYPSLSYDMLVVRDEGEPSSGQAAWRGNNAMWDRNFAVFGPSLAPAAGRAHWGRFKRHFETGRF
jgi:hypothetical protein